MKWYKHDSNANSDAKMRRVRLKYGMEGYGLYWYCLELIAQNVESHNLSFELEHDAEIIAADTGIHFERVQEMMTYMVKLGLFEQQQGIITCRKMLKRLDQSMTSNPEMRKLIEAAKHSHDSIMTVPDSVMQEEKRTEEIRTEQKRVGALPEKLNREAWESYLQHRRDLKAKRLTERGLQLAMQKLAELPHGEQLATVELSISNGWTGLFPEKRKATQGDAEDPYITNLRRSQKCSLQTT